VRRFFSSPLSPLGRSLASGRLAISPSSREWREPDWPADPLFFFARLVLGGEKLVPLFFFFFLRRKGVRTKILRSRTKTWTKLSPFPFFPPGLEFRVKKVTSSASPLVLPSLSLPTSHTAIPVFPRLRASRQKLCEIPLSFFPSRRF